MSLGIRHAGLHHAAVPDSDAGSGTRSYQQFAAGLRSHCGASHAPGVPRCMTERTKSACRVSCMLENNHAGQCNPDTSVRCMTEDSTRPEGAQRSSHQCYRRGREGGYRCKICMHARRTCTPHIITLGTACHCAADSDASCSRRAAARRAQFQLLRRGGQHAGDQRGGAHKGQKGAA